MEAKQWAIRGPGMPQMILRSDKNLKEEQVKKIYLSQFKARNIQYDSEVPWRIFPMSDEEIQKAGLSWCLRESRRKNHRNLIQVKDGKVIEDLREVVPAKKVNTKIDVSTMK